MRSRPPPLRAPIFLAARFSIDGCVSVLLFSGGKWRDEQWAGVDHLPQVVAESPTGGQLYLFPHQVAGSLPMFRGDRGELCKPATEMELKVYQCMPSVYPGLVAFTPTFYGASTPRRPLLYGCVATRALCSEPRSFRGVPAQAPLPAPAAHSPQF